MSPNKCELDKQKPSRKTAHIYIYIYRERESQYTSEGRGCKLKKNQRNKNTAESRTQLHYSPKKCRCDFADTVSGNIYLKITGVVQFVLNCNKHFRLLLDKYSLSSQRKVIYSMDFFFYLTFQKHVLKNRHGEAHRGLTSDKSTFIRNNII